jgi:hypothetical protein
MTGSRAFQRLLVMSLCLVLLAGIPAVSLADPITSISISGTGNTPSNGSSFSLDNFNSFSFSPNPGSPSGLAASPITYSLGTITVSGDNTSGTATLGSTFTISDSTGTATFDLTNPSTLNGSNFAAGNFGTGTFATLASNTTTDLNFGPIGGNWNFSTEVTNATLSAGSPGTASFGATVGDSVSMNFVSGPGSGVPEPASLLLWGILGMAGLCFGRGNLCRRLAV